MSNSMSNPLVYDYDPSKIQMSYELSLANSLKPYNPSDPSLSLYAGLDTYSFGTQMHLDPYSFSGQQFSMLYPDPYLQGNTVIYETSGHPLQAPAPQTQTHMLPAHETLYPPTAIAPAEMYNVPASLMRHSMSSLYSAPGLAPPIPSSSSSSSSRSLSDVAATVPTSWSLSGSLDPATGVFQRAPEHPRLRTAQACEKCRIRKAKCSGDRPTCARCVTRGLVCEYAAQRKMRGPNKVKRNGLVTGDSPAKGDRLQSVSSSDSSSDDMRGFELSDIPPAVVASTPSTPPNEQPELSGEMSLQYPVAPAPRTASPMDVPVGVDQRRRKRPPPIDLGSAGSIFSSVQSAFLNPQVYEASQMDHFNADRRASLPAYLLESYSRVAIDNTHPVLLCNRKTDSGESLLSEESASSDVLSMHSLPRSESPAPSECAPSTPLSLPSNMFDHGDLLYPSDLHAELLTYNHGVSPIEKAQDPMNTMAELDTITPRAREERPFDEEHGRVLEY
ncbi:hypothetical protein OBBRIDRAFT_836276 [Obba rivulosa]|uniref:Zn(2)-C6 fungal-type domain-containing protein n=1 Tax=Obba rivulosa TaxID=1052685 RepID=A0A8E2AQ25_9APHY|nr:hypothetical protein OBBRIDRAFT_836276 [Obba rivulosa]